MTTVAIMRWAREQRVGHVIAKSVLFVLASHADRDGYCKPSYRLIADEAEVSEATARRHMRALTEQGLVELLQGHGRAANRYRLALSVRRLGVAQRSAPSASPSDAQLDFDSASPERRTTTLACASSEPRSASQPARSASRRLSDQGESEHEVVPTELEELQEEAAPPPFARASAHERAPARGGGRGEHVPAAELNRTAGGGRAYLIVSEWAGRNPGIRNGERRELSKAVDQLLREGDVLPELIPAALDEAHHGRWRHPAAALPRAYDDVRRRAHPPVRHGPSTNPNDAAIDDLLHRTTSPTPRAIGGST